MKYLNRKPKSPLFRQARRVIILLGVGVGVIEVSVHYLQNGIHVDWYLFLEVVMFAVFIPLVGSLLLNLMQYIETGRLQAFDVLNHQLAIAHRFSSSSEWNEMLSWIAEYPSKILPLHRVVVYIQNLQGDQMALAAVWSTGQTDADELERAARPKPCRICQAGSRGFHRLVWDTQPVAGQGSTYCLPLILAENQLGLIQIAGKDPLPEEGVQMLQNIGPEIALVVDRARLQREAFSQAENNAMERKRIARDLHDTLGQSVAYLRLRLEHLTLSSNPTRQISEIRSELETMRDAANEAYHQVRHTLADLKTDSLPDLHQSMLEFSRKIGERAGFQVSLKKTGKPVLLGAHKQRQILYIFREALYNIEKHANARRVTVELIWKADQLLITIHDDGSGFETEAVDQQLHYGIAIMHDRAEDIEAKLMVESTMEKGTLISLTIPLRSPAAADEISEESMTIPLPIHGSESQDDEITGR